jgi:serine/threonine-protein kinase
VSFPTHAGPYRLVEELGRGNSGLVYAAAHEQTGVRYAVKLLGVRVEPRALRRFQREVDALARLSHPHVVRIHAADLEGRHPYMVQDLLSGGTLRDRLKDGPLPWREAVEVVRKLANGIAAAHTAGVLHRDLKPENVLFSEHGEPVLVDFGLAREVDGASSLTKSVV